MSSAIDVAKPRNLKFCLRHIMRKTVASGRVGMLERCFSKGGRHNTRGTRKVFWWYAKETEELLISSIVRFYKCESHY